MFKKKKISKIHPIGTFNDNEILNLFEKKTSHIYTLQQLYKKLRISNNASKQQVKNLIFNLIHHKKLYKISEHCYGLSFQSEYVVGVIDCVHADYSYVVQPGEQKDIIIKRHNLFTALDKDRVKVMVFPYKRGKRRPEGKVTEIIARSKIPIVGRVVCHKNTYYVIVEQTRCVYKMLVAQNDLQGAQINDKVVVLPLNNALSETEDGLVKGRVIEVLGPSGSHEVEMHAIIEEFGLQTHFPEEVLEEVHNISSMITTEEIKKRRDFRNIPTFTIDPADAKDFDDAISYRMLDNGYYEVGIHIADVSHYVIDNSKIDKEGYNRNFSVYLVDRTISMLPEILSNKLCSLNPYDDKLTFSVVIELDETGFIKKEWFGETIIRSQKRFTYKEAQQIITAQHGDFVAPLTQLNNLAKQLRAERIKRGAINFETREFTVQLDKNGTPLRIITEVREDAHKLIEEFMLLANRRVAHYVAHLFNTIGKHPTFIFRTHDKPDLEKLNDFFLVVKQFGYNVDTTHKSIAKTLNTLETAIQGTKEQRIIQSLAIRAMAKALYTTESKPHFALAFSHYTHFTSPIRRYPDIMVHRLLKNYLKGTLHKSQDDLRQLYEQKCQYALEREYLAAQAERASIKYKQVELMQTLQGKILQGVVGSITEWGIYVEILSNACEGMVRFSDMTDDFYFFEGKKIRVVGQQHKKIYRLGDIVNVKVKSCNLNKRWVDLLLVA